MKRCARPSTRSGARTQAGGGPAATAGSVGSCSKPRRTTAASKSDRFHDLVAVMVDHLQGDPPGRRARKRAGDVRVDRGPGLVADGRPERAAKLFIGFAGA